MHRLLLCLLVGPSYTLRHVIYRGRPTHQNVNSLRIDTSSSQKYLDLHLDSSLRAEMAYLILSKNGFHVDVQLWRQGCLTMSEIYGFEKLGGQHRLI